MVMKPAAGETGSRLDFTIRQPKEVGSLANRRRVYKSKLEGTVGDHTGDPAITADLWVIAEETGESAHLYLAEPAGLMRGVKRAGTPPTKVRTRALSPALEGLAKHDTLAEANVAPLLEQLTRTSLTTVDDISAGDVYGLIREVTAKRINDALSLGPSGPMRGRHLEALRRQVAPPVLLDLLDAAGTQSGRLSRLARIAEGLEPVAALLRGGPVAADSVIADTNVGIAIEQLVRGTSVTGGKIEKFADLDKPYRYAIQSVRQARGLGAYIDPPGGTQPTVESIVGPGTDLRTNEVTGAELAAGTTPINQSPALAAMKGFTVNRLHPDYPLVLDDLKNASVGGSKGAADRSLVVDALFASDTAGGTPKLATVDEKVCVPLAAKFASSPRTFTPAGHGGRRGEQLLARFPEGHFTVEIRGHKLEVYFHPEVHVPPYPP
jgi:hypothetical protein